MARRRAGQAKGGELVAIAMAAALLVFVGREAVRTARMRPPSQPTPAGTNDVAPQAAPQVAPPPAPVEQAGKPTAEDPPTVRWTPPTAARAALERAEIRRRIEAGAPGTYIADVLLDHDSVLVRWPERTLEPVRVWVQRSAAVQDWRPDFTRLAQEAFTEWGEVGFPVRFSFTADSSTAEVRVLFIDRFTDKDRLGLTTYRRDRNGWIASAEIVIPVHDSAGVALEPSLIAAIARHETGHALGLGHSKDQGTIMYPKAHTLTIAGPDRATVKLIYMLPPGSVK